MKKIILVQQNTLGLVVPSACHVQTTFYYGNNSSLKELLFSYNEIEDM